jgi:hypothetical protein
MEEHDKLMRLLPAVSESIAESNPVYSESLKRGAELLQRAGYPGFK